MATKECVTDILDMLLRAKPASKLESFEKTVEAWAMLLRNVPADELTQAAIMLALEPGPFIPDVGTLHNTALDFLDDQPTAEDAWVLVERKARGNAVDLPERAAAVLATMSDYRNWTEEEAPYRKREFTESYNLLRVRWKREEALALPVGEGRRLLDG